VNAVLIDAIVNWFNKNRIIYSWVSNIVLACEYLLIYFLFVWS
jgi:hypothetical protein